MDSRIRLAYLNYAKTEAQKMADPWLVTLTTLSESPLNTSAELLSGQLKRWTVRLNRRLLKSANRNRSECLKMIAFIETGAHGEYVTIGADSVLAHASGLHAHVLVDLPANITASAFEVAVADIWKKLTGAFMVDCRRVVHGTAGAVAGYAGKATGWLRWDNDRFLVL